MTFKIRKQNKPDLEIQSLLDRVDELQFSKICTLVVVKYCNKDGELFNIPNLSNEFTQTDRIICARFLLFQYSSRCLTISKEGWSSHLITLVPVNLKIICRSMYLVFSVSMFASEQLDFWSQQISQYQVADWFQCKI